MAAERITLLSPDGAVLAIGQVAEVGDHWEGEIDLRPMPLEMRRMFEDFEEIVNGQLFSHLDEIEDRIQSVSLRVAFADGSEAAPTDLQIYPGTRGVSFKAVKAALQRRQGA